MTPLFRILFLIQCLQCISFGFPVTFNDNSDPVENSSSNEKNSLKNEEEMLNDPEFWRIFAENQAHRVQYSEPIDSDETILDLEDFINLDTDPLIIHPPPIDPDYEATGTIEGDIDRIEDIDQFIKDSNNGAKNAVKDTYHLWPGGKIPYTISKHLSRTQRRYIAKAMDEYHKKTCIQFVPRNYQEHNDYIHITSTGRGCYSAVGRWSGKQDVSLDNDCISPGTVIHELMHVVGFFHEHSRSDRDKWIKIDWRNVDSSRKDNFKKISLKKITLLGVGYDYDSIMHYSDNAFSKNGKHTIIPLKSGGGNMGQRDGLSKTDIKKIQKLYNSCEKLGKSPGKSKNQPKLAKEACEDKNPACQAWKEKGMCNVVKLKAYLPKFCPASCGICTPNKKPKPKRTETKSEKCGDRKSQCETWVEKNYCKKGKLVEYMKIFCAESCGHCKKSSKSSTKSKKQLQLNIVNLRGGAQKISLTRLQ